LFYLDCSCIFVAMRKLRNHELNRKSIEEFKNTSKLPYVVVLDNVRSLNNIGSVFRTSDAFLIQEIYLCGITACPPNKEIHKTALGATESVSWKYVENTGDAINELKDKGFSIVSIEQAEGSISLEKFALEKDKKYAFIFWSRSEGCSTRNCK
jgi:23S rRNA (guanosine2251-2'-O)-methyltransferase